MNMIFFKEKEKKRVAVVDQSKCIKIASFHFSKLNINNEVDYECEVAESGVSKALLAKHKRAMIVMKRINVSISLLMACCWLRLTVIIFFSYLYTHFIFLLSTLAFFVV